MTANGSAGGSDRVAARRRFIRILFLAAAFDLLVALMYFFVLHQTSGVIAAGVGVVVAVYALYLRLKSR